MTDLYITYVYNMCSVYGDNGFGVLFLTLSFSRSFRYEYVYNTYTEAFI